MPLRDGRYRVPPRADLLCPALPGAARPPGRRRRGGGAGRHPVGPAVARPALRAVPQPTWSRSSTPRAGSDLPDQAGVLPSALLRHPGRRHGLRLRRPGGLRDAGAADRARQVDKSSRFTDWSRRPLSDAQMAYALADVTHLRASTRCSPSGSATGRDGLGRRGARRPDRSRHLPPDPDEAWTRIKTRSNAPRFVAALRELARLRETLAQARNVPRGRILKDDALLELAANRPRTSRTSPSRASSCARRAAARSPTASSPPSPPPRRSPPPRCRPPSSPSRKPGSEALADLLRVLLKARAEAEGVAQRLIASGADLDAIASATAPTSRRSRLAPRGLRPRRPAPEARRDRPLRRGRRGQGGPARLGLPPGMPRGAETPAAAESAASRRSPRAGLVRRCGRRP